VMVGWYRPVAAEPIANSTMTTSVEYPHPRAAQERQEQGLRGWVMMGYLSLDRIDSTCAPERSPSIRPPVARIAQLLTRGPLADRSDLRCHRATDRVQRTSLTASALD
jgi:hypothetical protein